jgi:peptidoglycan/LPS O-acetylase OafA/YrhL
MSAESATGFIYSIYLSMGSRVRCWPGLAFHLWGADSVVFIVMSAMSIAAAAVSWHLFEQPLNRLKERLYVFPSMSVLPIKDISTNAPEPEGG